MADKWSGYWIPLWINPLIPASKIAEYKRTKTPEYFYNFVAGLPYVNANDKLSQQALERCLSKEINEQKGRIIIGIDTGHNLHYTLMNKEGVFYHGYCATPQEMNDPDYDPYLQLEKLLATYPRSILMSDQGGDLIGIRKLQVKYPGRVFLVWFVKETRNKQLIRWGEGDEYGKVLVDRNRVVQLAVDQINEQRMIFNGSKDDWQPFFEHALNIYRVKDIMGQDENDPQYGWRWIWKRKGPDHWFMSLIYALVGFDRFQEDLAQVVSKKSFYSGIPQGQFADKGRIIRGEDFTG